MKTTGTSYRTTPKAFIPLSVGQELWQSRFGKLTSLRIIPPTEAARDRRADKFKQKLKTVLEPASMGLRCFSRAPRGFGSVARSYRLRRVLSLLQFLPGCFGLMLAALFFKLGVEQRLREIGVLRCNGFSGRENSQAVSDGRCVACGCRKLAGFGGRHRLWPADDVWLRTWWVDAVGTTMLRLHVSPVSHASGRLRWNRRRHYFALSGL